ncbi:MAG: hypothetical protein ACJ74T_03790 [Pyrinomonadaceae bacterium]
MKHRSVIAFVIVAAALFSLPQLSHDLRALKGEVGARLHRELLHAFLNLPAGEPTAAAPVAHTAQTLLASCPKERSAAPPVKSAKVASSGRVEGRGAEKSYEQSAMIGDPANDPINHVASVDIEKAASKAAASLPELKVETEVAMIIPPESGIDPHGLVSALTSNGAAREESKHRRVEADGVRVAYTAARFEAQSPEWQKVTEEAVRKLNGSLPSAYEFRVLRDGAKLKVLKLKCGDCPATAPRLPRAPRPVASGMPLPSTFAPAEWVSE